MAANGYKWDHNTHRLRCLEHIIYLAAEDFFFKEALGPGDDVAWRQFGCYGKLYNIVLWVQKSPQRMERFKLINHLILIRDNFTRWHLYYDMCDRALQLREEITYLLTTEPELDEDSLRVADWGYLNNIKLFLQPFRIATKANEGWLDAIDRMLPGLEFLMAHLENARKEYARNPYMRDRVQRAWEKLDKYYNLIDKSVAYIGATVLNPIYKWQWFEACWTTPNLAHALIQGKTDLQQLWESNYANAYTS